MCSWWSCVAHNGARNTVWSSFTILWLRSGNKWDFSVGPVVRIYLPMQRTQVQYLVGELRSSVLWSTSRTLTTREASMLQWRAHVPQQRPSLAQTIRQWSFTRELLAAKLYMRCWEYEVRQPPAPFEVLCFRCDADVRRRNCGKEISKCTLYSTSWFTRFFHLSHLLAHWSLKCIRYVYYYSHSIIFFISFRGYNMSKISLIQMTELQLTVFSNFTSCRRQIKMLWNN